MKRAGCIALMALSSCGPTNDKPPEPPKRASAEERILSVGRTWQESTRSEGFINDAEIAFMRATDKVSLRFEDGSRTALADVEREELIRTPAGREYHCTVSGAVKAVVKFSWRGDEAAMMVKVPASTHRRVCKETGFPRAARQFEPLNAIYVLRGDRLVAVDPPTSRSSLIPSD
jgi:hypothetical protein